MNEPAIDLSQLRVAVVGLGSIGNRHLRNLGELGVTQRIVVRRADGANRQFQTTADVRVCHSPREAISAGLDLAIICTPSRMHHVSAAPFLEAGVAVLIEKPVEAQLSAAAKLQQLATRHECYASVAYCMRYHPAYRAAKEFVRAGELGEVHSARAWFHTYLPDWHPYEDYKQSYAARADLGGGVIPTLDHEVDFLLWVLGDAELRSARLTSGRESLGIDVPAVAEMELEHTSGCRSQISLSFAERNFARGFEFNGAAGTLSLDFAEGALRFVTRDQPDDSREIVTAGADAVEAMYRDLLRNVLREVAASSQPTTPLSAGVAALAICEQAIHFGGDSPSAGRYS